MATNIDAAPATLTESDIPRVNKPNRDCKAELDKVWVDLEARAKAIMETEVTAYTKKLWEAWIVAVY